VSFLYLLIDNYSLSFDIYHAEPSYASRVKRKCSQSSKMIFQ
jgi:hypothetical protein